MAIRGAWTPGDLHDDVGDWSLEEGEKLDWWYTRKTGDGSYKKDYPVSRRIEHRKRVSLRRRAERKGFKVGV